MTTDDLAGLLYAHQMFDGLNFDHCECGERIGTEWEDMATHQAAVIAAAGWVKGREEFGVTDTGDGGVDEIEPPTREWASRVAAADNAHLRRNGMEGESIVVRRYVTDWEEVPRET